MRVSVQLTQQWEAISGFTHTMRLAKANTSLQLPCQGWFLSRGPLLMRLNRFGRCRHHYKRGNPFYCALQETAKRWCNTTQRFDGGRGERWTFWFAQSRFLEKRNASEVGRLWIPVTNVLMGISLIKYVELYAGVYFNDFICDPEMHWNTSFDSKTVPVTSSTNAHFEGGKKKDFRAD